MNRPDRKRNRLGGYDYSRDGLYFLTICVHERIEWFGRVAQGVVLLNETGRIADERRQWLCRQYPYVDLGPSAESRTTSMAIPASPPRGGEITDFCPTAPRSVSTATGTPARIPL